MKNNLKKPKMKHLLTKLKQEAHLSESRSTEYYLNKKQLQELVIYIQHIKEQLRSYLMPLKDDGGVDVETR